MNAIGTKLLFVTLEINRLEDEALERRSSRRRRRCGHFEPWLRDVPQLPPAPARRRDREGAAREIRRRPQPPGSRLFDETIGGAALPARRPGADQRRDLRHALGKDRAARKAAAVDRQGAGQEHAAVRPDHQHAGQGQGDRGRLAQVRAADLVAQPRQPGRGRGGGRAGRRRAGRLSAALAPLLRAQGEMDRASTSCAYWDRNAPLPEDDDTRDAMGRGQGRRARRLSALLAGAGADRRRFFEHGWIDAAARPGKDGGAFCPSDRAERAPLRADELPGQEPGRDDAGARARATACTRCWRRARAR